MFSWEMRGFVQRSIDFGLENAILVSFLQFIFLKKTLLFEFLVCLCVLEMVINLWAPDKGCIWLG